MTESLTGGCCIHARTAPRLTLIFSLLIAAPAMAQEEFDSLADRLIEMRGEVDSLQSELNLQREEHKNRMAYLTAQEADLEASKDREALRVLQLEDELNEIRAEVAAAGDTSETLAPIVLDHIAALREQVRSGYPFKVQERLAALDEIADQLENGVINAQRGINRLWAFVEDEIRITRENAIYTQSINLNGENILVDIAKLGSSMMYFRTRDRAYGRAVSTDSGWKFELLESTADQEQVATLFDSLRKQIRQGYFELPYALPAAGGSS